MPESKEYAARKWTGEDVTNILANPIYAGVGPFPAIVSDETWVKGFIKLMGEKGVRQALTLMLKQLRESIPSQ